MKFKQDSAKILELRKQGKTLQEIGDHFGVTRQSIEIMAKKIPDFKKYKRTFKYPAREAVCPKCDTSFKILIGHRNQKCCSWECLKHGRTPEEQRAFCRDMKLKYYATPKGKSIIKKIVANQSKKDRNNLKRNARAAISRHLKKGSIIKPHACVECKETRVVRLEAHHDDYRKPLDVRWLCTVCHSLSHKK